MKNSLPQLSKVSNSKIYLWLNKHRAAQLLDISVPDFSRHLLEKSKLGNNIR